MNSTTAATTASRPTMHTPHHWLHTPLWLMGSVGLSGVATKLMEHGLTLQGVASLVAAVGTTAMAVNVLYKTLRPDIDRVLTLVEQRWGRPK
jgi:hypothetical protein